MCQRAISGVTAEFDQSSARADQENAKRFKWIFAIKHNHFWSALHLFIAAGGIYLLTIYPAQQAANMPVKPAINDTAKKAAPHTKEQETLKHMVPDSKKTVR